MEGNTNYKIKIHQVRPLLLTVFIVFLDQLTKNIVSTKMVYGESIKVFSDFFRITYVKNPNIAFSIGYNMPASLKVPIFLILITIAMVTICYYLVKSILEKETMTSWMMATILGGAIGNISDRFIRRGGVVDFLDIKFYGIFGWERWPTFNIADISIVFCGFFFVFYYLFYHETPTTDTSMTEDKNISAE